MDVDSGDGKKEAEIDESLYSRQLYVMGREAQRKMAVSDVLIIGLNGLGVEIAKNVILAGVKSVSLHDTKPTQFSDLSAQFYLSEEHIGKPRAESCASKLADLNQYVPVTVISEALKTQDLGNFSVVVVVDETLEKQLEINEYCHAHDIKFVAADVRGVFASVFCDFGDSFTVFDTNGEQPITRMISSITSANPGIVTVHEDARHGLETGDFVSFSEVAGMEELNNSPAREIKVLGPYTFSIEDTTGYGSYAAGGGGYVNQVKQTKTVNFKPLRASLSEPGEFLMTDFGKFGRSEVLHHCFQALAQFQTKHGALPSPGSSEHADEMYATVQSLNDAATGALKVDGLDSHMKVIKQFAIGAAGVISPMCAFLGGIVGQEVLKACSGKFSPIHQYLYFDAVECLPDEPLAPEQYAPTGSRYDSQIAVFGRDMQATINDLNYFLVGAGAIGCEMLKNWALMGVGASDAGAVHVTDMDCIEKSNLSRQFLFRNNHLQQPKSRVAAEAVMAMNPGMRVKSYENRVGGDTEHIFNDDFYASLSGVCTALDNVDARLYMDQRCLFYQLPMLESGTLGTKGNTQIVVPNLTENYGASRDPPEKSVPICTLKNFPNQIEHTLQWARDWFEGVYNQCASDVNSYLSNADYIASLDAQQNTKLETLQRIHDNLTTKPLTFDECIVWARNRFEEMFSNSIKQLLHNFPLDQKTSSGTPFWSGTKRAPTPLTFDMHDATHLAFVVSVANLRAENFGLSGSESE